MKKNNIKVENGKRVINIKDVDHWVKFAVVREDERLYQAFINIESFMVSDPKAPEQTKNKVPEFLHDFIHLNYNMMIRDEVEQFCGDFSMTDKTNIIINGMDAYVEIDGQAGKHFDLRIFEDLADLAA